MIPGKALAVSMSGAGTTLDCTDCHAGSPHNGNKTLDSHIAKVACQACHIPTFARVLPTMIYWDWSTAGKDQPSPLDKYGLKTYDKQKGSFVWGKDVVPFIRLVQRQRAARAHGRENRRCKGRAPQ